MQFAAYVSGFAMLLVFWVLYRLMAGTWDIWKLVEGSDGHPSTSKLQWFIWTVVVLFAYVVIYAARIYDGNIALITDIPQNLLIAMGFSITSMVAAKGITASYVANGQLSKPQVDPETTGLGSVVQDDLGVPDLGKIQVMAWTIIAVVSYLIRVAEEIHAGSPVNLPDIDPALMVLMGLGHGAYLGKKLVTTSTPRLTGLSPGQGTPGTLVTLTGTTFGDTQNGSLLTIDGQPVYPQGLTWGDTQISFQIPAQQYSGLPWNPGQRILIGVTVHGQESGNTLPFTVMVNAPQGSAATPPPTSINPQITDSIAPGNAPSVSNAPQAPDAGTVATANPDPTQVNPQITDAVQGNATTVNDQVTD